MYEEMYKYLGVNTLINRARAKYILTTKGAIFFGSYELMFNKLNKYDVLLCFTLSLIRFVRITFEKSRLLIKKCLSDWC